MSKAILIMDMPNNCARCKLKKRPSGISFPEDMICCITEKSIYENRPSNIQSGTKPDWCPLKEMSKEKGITTAFEREEK